MPFRKRIEYPHNGLLTIDPGWNTGIAVWDGTKKPKVFSICLPSRMLGCTKEQKIYWMLDKFQVFVNDFCVDVVDHAVIEGVGLWSATKYRRRQDEWVVIGDTKSFIAARMGHTFTLGYLIGGFVAVLGAKSIPSCIVNVPTWKGNKTKQAVAEEVKRINGEIYRSDHISDAVGLGFSTCGLITRKHINNKRGGNYGI